MTPGLTPVYPRGVAAADDTDSSPVSPDGEGQTPRSLPSAPPQPQIPRVTERMRDTLAEQHLLGLPVSEMAQLHNLPLPKVHALFQTQDLKDRIALKREHLLAAGARVMFKFLIHAEQLAQAQVDCAFQNGPDQYKARTWILERVAPARHTSQSQVDVNVNVNHEVMVGLRDALRETNVALAGRPTNPAIRLLDGRTAMPSVDFEMGDAEADEPQ